MLASPCYRLFRVSHRVCVERGLCVRLISLGTGCRASFQVLLGRDACNVFFGEIALQILCSF